MSAPMETDAPPAAPSGPAADDNTKGAKGRQDYEKIAAELAAHAELAKQGKLTEAVEAMLAVEKTQRLAADAPGTKLAVLAICRACADAGAWQALNDNVLLLAKRRAQLKQAVTAMVQECMALLPRTPTLDARLDLIKTLGTVAAGKIYVEVERARLTRMLAAIKESQGLAGEAAEVMQEVAVETYGALAKEEKIAFILEQVRLVLDRGDYVRALILAKKINPASFKEKPATGSSKAIRDSTIAPPAEGTPSLPELKVSYYQLMIRYYMHGDEYLEAARCWQHIYDTHAGEGAPAAAADGAAAAAASDAEMAEAVAATGGVAPRPLPPAARDALKRIAWLLVLAPRSPMRESQLAAAAANKRLADDLPTHKALVTAFTTAEVVRWSAVEAAYGPEMAAQADLFGPGPAGDKRRADLRLRCEEHNVHCVARYYARISVARLGELLDLPPAAAEERFAAMVAAKALAAKLDRPAGVVTFGGGAGPAELLNRWAGGTDRLLGLLEAVCHKVHKEATAHKVSLDGTAAAAAATAADGPGGDNMVA